MEALFGNFEGFYGEYGEKFLPAIVASLICAIFVFAWRSTEVSTPDRLEGQFNIPGRGTFNIIPESTTAERPEQTSTSPEGLRRRHNPSGSSSENSTQNSAQSADAGNSRTEPPPTEAVFDEGDLNEPELTTKIRFLDESEILCRFRPSQSLGDFKRKNIEDSTERGRLCLIFGGMPLKDEKAKMSRIGVKDGDTMHGFYKTLPPEPNPEERNNNASSSYSHPRTGQHSPQLDEDDFFDEISRWFVPAIGGILGVAWLYLITAPYPMTFSTHLSMFFITSVFVGFIIMNRA